MSTKKNYYNFSVCYQWNFVDLRNFVMIKSNLDRESSESDNGAYIVQVRATEQIKPGVFGDSITNEITIIVQVT